MPKFTIFFSSLIGIFLILMVGGALSARRRVKKAVKAAYDSCCRSGGRHYSENDLIGLPAVVQKYFRTVLKEGQEHIQFVETVQEAQLRRTEEGGWTAVKAAEYFSVEEPALVWNAFMRDAKYVWRKANLIYLDGQGSGLIKLFGGITLSEPDGPEADVSLLIRYLTEMVWFPTALLPGGHVRWEPMDERSACASISDGELTASATFHFSESGEVERITTRDKFRDLKSGFEREHFTMYCRNWDERNGVRIPLEVDFEWNFEKRNFTYAKFFIKDIAYTFARSAAAEVEA